MLIMRWCQELEPLELQDQLIYICVLDPEETSF